MSFLKWLLGTDKLKEAYPKVNDNFDYHENRINNIVSQAGSDNTEIVDARQSIYKGKNFTVLRDRLEEIEEDHGDHLFETAPHSAAETLQASTQIQVTSTTDATSPTAAPLKSAGGLAVAKKCYLGDEIVTNSGNLLRVTQISSLSWAQNIYREFIRALNGTGTIIEFTIPHASGSAYFLKIEVEGEVSRIGATAQGICRIAKAVFTVGRNNGNTNVVLDTYAGLGYEEVSTTSGGGNNASAMNLAIDRSGAEANTEPQVVKITTSTNFQGLYYIKVRGWIINDPS